MDARVLVRLALALAVTLLAGCSTSAVSTADGPCLAMRPHFPQMLRRADTPETKADGYRRNAAFDAVCPPPAQPGKPGWSLL
ncbi:MAG: hypothetical protein WAS51_14380 [Ilumatobacteraceae bacterium]